ncbi:MAG TPA: hypothetical protein VLJ21_04195 [Candidatus Binatia bacterium]|nr:hypothetical protein [Candidatus Binatia bacterium]
MKALTARALFVVTNHLSKVEGSTGGTSGGTSDGSSGGSSGGGSTY